MTRAAGVPNIIYGRKRARERQRFQDEEEEEKEEEEEEEEQGDAINCSCRRLICRRWALFEGEERLIRDARTKFCAILIYIRVIPQSRAPREVNRERGRNTRTIGICCCLFVAQT